LLYEARASAEVVAPTVIAVGSDAGEELHASLFSLPAATAVMIPALRIDASPALSEADLLPPIDMLATHLRPPGEVQFCSTLSMPLRMPLQEPLPRSPMILTLHTRAFFAMPYVLPAITPAQCVPWPLTSAMLLYALQKWKARPSNSECVVLMPVSRTNTSTPSP